MYIFSDMVADTLEIFMDDFSLVGDSFDDFVVNLVNALQSGKEFNIVLN